MSAELRPTPTLCRECDRPATSSPSMRKNAVAVICVGCWDAWTKTREPGKRLILSGKLKGRRHA